MFNCLRVRDDVCHHFTRTLTESSSEDSAGKGETKDTRQGMQREGGGGKEK